jgi:hypothetical protein
MLFVTVDCELVQIGAFKNDRISQTTACAKKLLTGKVLKQLYPESSIRITGFEEIPDREMEI